jgi:hypothetical protein
LRDGQSQVLFVSSVSIAPAREGDIQGVTLKMAHYQACEWLWFSVAAGCMDVSAIANYGDTNTTVNGN